MSNQVERAFDILIEKLIHHESAAFHCALEVAAVREALQSAEPVVDVNQQLVEALLMFVQNSSVQVLVPVTCEIAEEALLSAWLLSAGKGGEV